MNPALSGLLSALTYGVGDFLAGLASRRDSPLRVVALTHPISAMIMLLLAVALGQALPPVGDLLWGALAGAVGLFAVLAFYRALALGPMGAVSVGAGALSALVPVVFGVLGGEVLDGQTVKVSAGPDGLIVGNRVGSSKLGSAGERPAGAPLQ